MSIFLFYDQPGTVPGYPGMYAHCQVRVTDGKLEVSPLPRAPHVLESPVVDSPAEGENTAEAGTKDAAKKRKGAA